MNESADHSASDAPAEVQYELNIDDALTLAIRLHRNNQPVQAEPLYRAVLAADPERVDALHFLGVLRHQTGHSAEAAELIGRAIAICPGYADAHNNLGNVLCELGRLSEAADAYRQAIALAPRRAEFYQNWGVVLKQQGRYEEAAAAFRQAIDLEPGRGNTYFNLAGVLARQEDWDASLQTSRRAIELRPQFLPAYEAMSRVLYRLERREEAIELFEQLLRQMPDSPFARHMLAAWSGQLVPPRASDAYVQQIFDDFAEDFDEVLQELNYQAPALIAAAMNRELGGAEPKWDVLDAGCGTGLGGPLLQPYARRLVGVDLSARMLDEARKRGLYDELVQAELTCFLRGQTACHDVIASADTLIYFGELAPVLIAAAGALRTSGVLVFTLENGGDARLEAGFRLQPHGRYVHNDEYVRATLGKTGLTVRSIAQDVLRNEGGSPVAGLVVTARKG